MAKLMFNELGKIFGYSDAVRKERFREETVRSQRPSEPRCSSDSLCRNLQRASKEISTCLRNEK